MRGARQFFLLALLSLALCSYYFGVEMIVKRAELNEEARLACGQTAQTSEFLKHFLVEKRRSPRSECPRICIHAWAECCDGHRANVLHRAPRY